MRDRSWRRWRSEVKLEKVKRYRNQLSIGYWKKYYQGNRYVFRYNKRNSITEIVEVEIKCQSHFEDYLKLNSRRLRDNPKRCSCWFCCNPRKALAGSKKSLTLDELILRQDDINDMGE